MASRCARCGALLLLHWRQPPLGTCSRSGAWCVVGQAAAGARARAPPPTLNQHVAATNTHTPTQVITPWDVSGGADGKVDYNKLVAQFGVSLLTDDLVKRCACLGGAAAERAPRAAFSLSPPATRNNHINRHAHAPPHTPTPTTTTTPTTPPWRR